MRLFPLITIIFVVFTAVFHFLFIMYDYAYYNNETGIFTIIPEAFNETLNTVQQNQAWNHTIMFRQAFGVGRFIVLGLSITFFAISVADHVLFTKKQGQGP